MSSETDNAAQRSRNSWIWISLGVVVCLSVLLGQVPARVRLLGLFAIGEGVLIGLSSSYWAERDHAARSLKSSVLVGALGIAAFGGTSVLWWRQYADALERAYQAVPPNMLAMQLQSDSRKPGEGDRPSTLDQQKLGTNIVADALKERRPELDARESLSGYLVFRLFGAMTAAAITENAPQGYVLWSTELLLAGIAAAISFRKGSASSHSSAQEAAAAEPPADSKTVSEG